MPWDLQWYNNLSKEFQDIVKSLYSLTQTTFKQLITLQYLILTAANPKSEEIINILSDVHINLKLTQAILIAIQVIHPYHTDYFMVSWFDGVRKATNSIPALPEENVVEPGVV